MAKVWKQLQRADSAFAGNVTGTVDGVAVATIKSGAAKGTTSNQDSTSTIRSGTTAANVGLGNVPNYSAATMRAGVSASDVGLGNVPNYSAATMRGGVTSSDVGLGNVANESRATILAGTFTGDVTGTVNGASAATIKSGAASGTSAKSAVDGNASITMVGGTLSIGTTVGGVYPFAVSSSGALAIAGDEFTVAATGEVSSKGSFTINQDASGDSEIILAGDSTGTARVEVNGANPQFDLGGTSPLGSSTMYIRRGGTGNSGRILFITGSTTTTYVGSANQPIAYNDQFGIHHAHMYDNTSPYFERDFSLDASGRMGFWANDKTAFNGVIIGSDGTNKGLYVKNGGIGVGFKNTTDGTLQTSGNITVGGILNSNDTDAYDKIRVWENSNYTIGMKSACTFGSLNDYAMTFTMNNDGDRGFLWRDVSDSASDGAMSLTTGGSLAVKKGINVGVKQNPLIGGWHSNDKIFVTPADFIVNDDNSYYNVALVDNGGELKPMTSALEAYVNIPIPEGYKAVTFRLNGTGSVSIGAYYSDVTTATATSCQPPTTVYTNNDYTFYSSAVAYTSSGRYIILRWAPSSTSHRLYGGYITIEPT